ncbi:MAG: IclR family transcriptional regulator [Clostridia bacterium]|nr:IclR family transcriptional regulator [Clostridia bacterium]
MKEQKHPAPAIAAAIKIINSIAASNTPLGLSEICTLTGLNSNMVSRALCELTAGGWIVLHPDTNKFSLTLQLFRVGSTALHKKTLTACAPPYMERLNKTTGETIQLAVMHNQELIYINQIESKKEASIKGQIGASYPIDITAPGKVFRAFSFRDVSLESVIQNGYATDNEEYSRGVLCIAAPVFDYTGSVIATINLASLTVNISMEEMINRYAPLLLQETKSLSEELGYTFEKGAFTQ